MVSPVMKHAKGQMMIAFFRAARPGVTLGLCALFLAAATVVAKSAEPTVVNVGIVNAISDGLIFIAEKKGYFGEEGIAINTCSISYFLARAPSASPVPNTLVPWKVKPTLRASSSIRPTSSLFSE